VDAASLEFLYGDRRPRHQDNDSRDDVITEKIADFDLSAVAALWCQHRKIGRCQGCRSWSWPSQDS
jgi:hypothetical protein